ncbi:hypothetical protein X777_04511, partial [Ooceraea biroi]
RGTGLSPLLWCLSKALLESGKKLTGRLPATLMLHYNVPRSQPSSHADPSSRLPRDATRVIRGQSSVITRGASKEDLGNRNERSLFALPHSTPPFTTGEAVPAALRNDPLGGSSNERPWRTQRGSSRVVSILRKINYCNFIR